MVTMVIIGVLSGIATISVGAMREKAHYAAMRSDLRRLVSMEEAYWESTTSRRRGPRYGNLRQLQNTMNFATSPGVTIRIRANRTGWSAQTRHTSLGRRKRCAMFMGTNIRPFRPAKNQGVLACQ